MPDTHHTLASVCPYCGVGCGLLLETDGTARQDRLTVSGLASLGDEKPGASANLEPMPNDPCDTWAEFYATQRLLPLARLARDGAALPEPSIAALERLAASIDGMWTDATVFLWPAFGWGLEVGGDREATVGGEHVGAAGPAHVLDREAARETGEQLHPRRLRREEPRRDDLGDAQVDQVKERALQPRLGQGEGIHLVPLVALHLRLVAHPHESGGDASGEDADDQGGGQAVGERVAVAAGGGGSAPGCGVCSD